MTADLVKGIRDQVAGATYQGRVAILHREDEYQREAVVRLDVYCEAMDIQIPKPQKTA